MNENYDMLAKCLYGFEPVLARELRHLGAQNVKEGVRNVKFKGDKGFMYKANLALRTAIRILVPIETFILRNEDDLYNYLSKVSWEKYLNETGTLAIHSSVNSQIFSNSHYVSLRSKDAIVDYFRRKYHKRPSIDIRHPDVQFDIHIQNNTCTVSLDSSGESLHKRGYRSDTNIAPINEVLAAGLILMTGYDGSQHFIDPMCGSGTLLIEAAMIANNIPANINRQEFAFEKWQDYDEDLFSLIHDSLLKRIRNNEKKIMGFDKAPSAVRKAQNNVSNASLEDFISVDRKNFFVEDCPVEGNVIVLFNPPYGERLTVNVPVFYREIGDTLKQHYPDTNVWLITSDFNTGLKNVGLRTSRKIKVFNGKLECRFVKYEMYAGSRKAKKQDDQNKAN
ncbi:THUMP domain-containing class I SAM-dependent RNA methyltransferase [Lutimonas zeaxanthinifaciens]|uniref:THUMP domain-containing class I SAM-dependent RNA methyltransferase n=1 Tax=Lutimonas zeaxanthinifaciens TaxID=3060215 RepID=UPI00265CEB88|nr:class I SAM-dependent RNA methyltransferase [Lutimonas sp. YSD2104]WKK67447.1 class I SAM-dependent RNA methyltransferase [Lutimonas sp. YSD2104]